MFVFPPRQGLTTVPHSCCKSWYEQMETKTAFHASYYTAPPDHLHKYSPHDHNKCLKTIQDMWNEMKIDLDSVWTSWNPNKVHTGGRVWMYILLRLAMHGTGTVHTVLCLFVFIYFSCCTFNNCSVRCYSNNRGGPWIWYLGLAFRVLLGRQLLPYWGKTPS